MTFRGRELAHPEAGHRLLEKVVKDLETVGQVEIPARMEGRSLVLLMVPRPLAGRASAKPAGVTGSSKPASAAGSTKQPSAGGPAKQPSAANLAKQNVAAGAPKQPTTKP